MIFFKNNKKYKISNLVKLKYKYKKVYKYYLFKSLM